MKGISNLWTNNAENGEEKASLGMLLACIGGGRFCCTLSYSKCSFVARNTMLY